MAGTVASSYNWSTLFEGARSMGAKKIQVGTQDKLICQKVNSTMWTYYPWKWTLKPTVPNSIPLISGVQDYPRMPDCYRLIKGAIWMTDSTPFQIYDFVGGISRALCANLQQRSPRSITTMSDEIQLGVWRLEAAVNASLTCDLRCEYQPYVGTLQDLGVTCWFPDDYVNLAEEGILYWLYKYGEDERAGSATYTESGSVQYSGQLAIYMGALAQAAKDEDSGALISIFPAEGFGENRCGSNNVLLGI